MHVLIQNMKIMQLKDYTRFYIPNKKEDLNKRMNYWFKYLNNKDKKMRFGLLNKVEGFFRWKVSYVEQCHSYFDIKCK